LSCFRLDCLARVVSLAFVERSRELRAFEEEAPGVVVSCTRDDRWERVMEIATCSVLFSSKE
jgi:hypothetical protein